MYKIKSQWLALLGGALLTTGAAFGQQPAQNPNQSLLDLLVRKGVITEQEAAGFAKEATAPSPATGTVPVVATSDKSPLSFIIGAAQFTPVGFVDFTTYYRSTDVGSGLGTSFGSIPFRNATSSASADGQLSETRFTAQNSRLGLKVDSNVGDAKVLGYVESDFLGNSAVSLSTTSNSATLRMRVYFADVTMHDWEFLAGQDWSMLTPNRKGISPMPSDIFYTLDMDANYQSGLVWARQPQIRAVYHASDEFTFGLSLENPDQYTSSTSTVTLPGGFNTAQVDTGSNSNGTVIPNLIPDIIVKAAYDTKLGDLPWHIEAAGLYREFKVASPNNATDSASGVGAAFNMNLALCPSLHLIETAFWSDGGGRYIANESGPDFIVRPANAAGVDTISPVHSYSGILGLEWQAAPKSMLFGYYSLADFGKDYVGTVGYGYPGSTNANHTIDEYTLGAIQTIWKDPQHGALQLIAQASYLDRKPWSVPSGTPSDAHVGMVFFDVRYVFP